MKTKSRMNLWLLAAAQILLFVVLPYSVGAEGFGSTTPLDGGFTGKIYYLPEGTQVLPDFSTLEPVGTIYTDKLDIPNRDFSEGFPGVTDRFEWFGIQYTGTFNVVTAGEYNFQTVSDDGSKLYIDNILVVDNDGIHGSSTQTGKITLTPGSHNVRVDYFQGPATRIELQVNLVDENGTAVALTLPAPVSEPAPLHSAPTVQPAPTNVRTGPDFMIGLFMLGGIVALGLLLSAKHAENTR